MSETTPVLRAQNLSGGVSEAVIVKDIQLSVEPGSIVGILGKRGAGKRQLLELLAGVQQASNGRVLLREIDVSRYGPRERRRAGIEYDLYPDGMFTRLWTALRRPSLLNLLTHRAKMLGKRPARDHAAGWLDRFDLLRCADRRPNNLSGGMRYWFNLAQLMISDPLIVLLDEPFAGFDPLSVRLFTQRIREFTHTFGTSFVIADRRVPYRQMYDSTFIMENGILRQDHGMASSSAVRHEQIFISYSREDENFAEHFSQLLSAIGIRPWIDNRNLTRGAHFDSRIEEGIQDSSALLVLLSPRSVVSRWVLDETAFALEAGIRVVPVMVEKCQIPIRLGSIHHIDWEQKMTESTAVQAECLAHALSHQIELGNQERMENNN